jgi:hypothetical protein
LLKASSIQAVCCHRWRIVFVPEAETELRQQSQNSPRDYGTTATGDYNNNNIIIIIIIIITPTCRYLTPT